MDKILPMFWKYAGSLLTDPKGPGGSPAASYTRVLGVTLFGLCAWKWMHGVEVPEQAFWTLMLLVGVKGARDLVPKKA